MKASAFSVVRTTRTEAEAGMLIGFMRGAGLHPLDLNTSSICSFAGADVQFYIEVPTAELNTAREFLQSLDHSNHAA